MMYNDNEKERCCKEAKRGDTEEYRTVFRRDFARVIHSYSMRRLVGKTQLFPTNESDYFRNRLTHTMEVAQLAKTIAIKINETDLKSVSNKNKIDLDLVELAGFAHDLGHPPFGHQGEEMLAECMSNYGGFEGNAQTLRLLTKIEKKSHSGNLENGGFDKISHEDNRHGLNLCFRSLASILKYDQQIPESNSYKKGEGKTKGYYYTEKSLVEQIKTAVTGEKKYEKFKTIECSIMDIADDIANSTYDLEDAFKAKFISPMDMLIQNDEFYEGISKEVFKSIGLTIKKNEIKYILSDLLENILFEFSRESLTGFEDLKEDDYELLKSKEYRYLALQSANLYNKKIVENDYVRSNFSSQLIKAAIKDVIYIPNAKIPALSSIELAEATKVRVEILRQIAFRTQILSPKLKALEYRGKSIIKKIFESLTPTDEDGKLLKTPPDLLPEDFQVIYKQKSEENHKYRVICDYIACMTDNYALEFYGRLTSNNPASIFRQYS